VRIHNDRVWSCDTSTTGEGGPFGLGNQVLLSSHGKLQGLASVPVSIAQALGRRSRQARSREVTARDTSVLSDVDVHDVAAYMNSLERPARSNLDKDFPPYGAYADGFPAERSMSRPCLEPRPSSAKLFPAQSLFLPAISHADVIFIVASVACMIFQASLLILAA
jgi:hypothetical protein